jgi:hypothetical protein
MQMKGAETLNVSIPDHTVTRGVLIFDLIDVNTIAAHYTGESQLTLRKAGVYAALL